MKRFVFALLVLSGCGGSGGSHEPYFGMPVPYKPDPFFATVVETDRWVGPVDVDLALRLSDAVDAELTPPSEENFAR